MRATARAAAIVLRIVPLALAGPALAGPDWQEAGDAGPLPPAAQRTIGSGPLSTISGSLSTVAPGTPDLQDMFEIRIVDPEAFSARTIFLEGTDFDSQLWLFTVQGAGHPPGLGLVGNDDAPDKPGIGSLLLAMPTDGTTVNVPPGNYYLAISGFNNDPASQGGPIFFQANFSEISGPDGKGGEFPVSNWVVLPPGQDPLGGYLIMLTGTAFAATPCPGDTNADRLINVIDLVNVVTTWGSDGHGEGFAADLDGNGVVNVLDLVEVITSWGACPAGCPGPGDCFVPGDTPGCNDPACCTAVCAVDPFCCQWVWDQGCVSQALALCGG
jgi:hypothetical protein